MRSVVSLSSTLVHKGQQATSSRSDNGNGETDGKDAKTGQRPHEVNRIAADSDVTLMTDIPGTSDGANQEDK